MVFNQDYANFLASFNSDKFRTLWPAQEDVLRSYAAKFSPGAIDEDKLPTDVAIELPTGAGKTLIALLIAEAWRKENKKVAILSANKTLARQMLAEAEALHLPAVLMEGKSSDIPSSAKRAYQRALKIAIMNYWVYFNQNPVIDHADLIIMDDAHLAELSLHSLYSVEISKYSHAELFIKLILEMQARFPDYAVFTDALLDDGRFKSPTQLLSFIDQITIADRFREIIDTSDCLETDQDLSYRWGRMRNKFRDANVYISTNSIWIRPYIYPLQQYDHYAKSQQRLYFSATVGDPSDLSRRLGAKTIQKIPVLPNFTETTSGRRLVVMGKMAAEGHAKYLTTVLFSAINVHPKSVWLCSSNAEAIRYKDEFVKHLESKSIKHDVWLLTPQGDEIEQFKKSPQGHLFVAGRFDGMDFSGDECRIVVIPTVPRAINLQEEFISEHLRDASFMKKRLNQRIVQALGRCNRSKDDFGVYILADQRFASHFSVESNRESIPRNIVAEIDMAQDLADGEEQHVLKEVEDFLKGSFSHYDLELSAIASSVPWQQTTTNVLDTSVDEVLGWNALFGSENYRIAAERFERCWNGSRKAEINLIEIGAFHGLNWAKALYLQSLRGEPSAREKSLIILDAAIKRGGQSSWFNRMSASLNRAMQSSLSIEEISQYDYADALIRKFDDTLEQLGVKGDKFEKWAKQISDALESSTHKIYQKGLKQLGELLGYYTVIPEAQGATDCLWRGTFGNSREVITFETKIEHESSQNIIYADVTQANGQLNRTMKEYPSYIVRSTIVTHLTSIAPEAEVSVGKIKVIEKEAILNLWERVKLLLSLYRGGWSINDFPARLAAAQSVRARFPKTGWLIRTLDDDRLFINSDLLLAGWS